jgi:hypothetical protein
MLVEDTTAFIEQLEVRRLDKRAEKHRRRRAHAEVALLRTQCEARVAAEALRSMEDELASLPEPGAASPGRRLLRARRRRSLVHEIETLRSRVRTKHNETLAARERLRRLDENGVHTTPPRGSRVFRLHSADHHLECSERRFARLATSQAELPVLVERREGRSWWWYLDRFWWGDDGLAAREVRIFVLDADLGRKQRAEAMAQARTRVLGEAHQRRVDEAVSQVVRFTVWCRDRGRCVDCGTAEHLRFDEILPLANGASNTAANVELRCDGCCARRAHNQMRARVGRAQVDAASLL